MHPRPLLLVLALVAAGCGGGEEAVPPAETSPEASTGPAEPEAATTAGGDAETSVPEPATSVADGWSATAITEGIKPALELDPGGSPAVAFVDEDFDGLVGYAASSEGWTPETIDRGYFYGPIDLAFDPEGRANVVFHDHESVELDPRAGNLAHALRDGGEWDVRGVRDDGHDGWDSGIEIGSDGIVRAAGVDPSQFDSEDGVEYYELRDGSWDVGSIGSGPVAYEFNVSLALGPDGLPALTYYDDTDGDLVFAAFDGEAWALETAVAEGDAGKFSSLELDADGRPHVSFFQQESETAGRIRYAVRDGGAWSVEDVAPLEDVTLGMVGARRNSSLELGPDGVPRVAFSDRSGAWLATRSGGGWEAEEVATAGERPLGQLVDLELGPDGTPHLAFFEVTSEEEKLKGLVVYVTRPAG